MILAGDIGGTNTTLAILDEHDGKFTIVGRKRYPSSDLPGLNDALVDFLGSEPARSCQLSVCCLSGAGPVSGNICRMTNVAWTIDGNAVQRSTGIRTFVINDFSAICYALPLIDTHPQIETFTLPHTNGSQPESQGPVRAVVGAGTGLGTGYLIEDNGHYTAHPSEAGHSAFSAVDAEMSDLQLYLDRTFGERQGAEQFVSGQGIRNIYRCFRATGRIPDDHVSAEIDASEPELVPQLVATMAADHAPLAPVMRLFVRMYARFASNTALVLLPTGGLYLAGGIAAKNERWILEDNAFMREFEQNYNDGIRPLLMSIPVILIKDYSVSLYGAGHAAVSLA
jgi:glucokinase